MINFGSLGTPDTALDDAGLPFVPDFATADFFFVSVAIMSSQDVYMRARLTARLKIHQLKESFFADYEEVSLRSAVQVGAVL